jgi:23S rRNA (uracil1939-C5)-methyltransferase
MQTLASAPSRAATLSAVDTARSPSIPACSHRPTCPGCPHFGVAGLATSIGEEIEQLAHETGAILAPVLEGTPHGHRHRARLMVRGRGPSPKVGLFQAGTHRIADIPNCPVHHPLVNKCAQALKTAIRTARLTPYADAAHRGLVRALQVVVERSSQTAQIVVVTNSPNPDACTQMLGELQRALGPELHSLWWNGNPHRTNTILGPHWLQIHGPLAVEENIGGVQVFFPPGAFGQSHLALADRIVESIQTCVEPGARVTEFYAGCGSIGLGLLLRGHELTFNEISPAGLQGLELGIARLRPEFRDRARIVAGPAGSCVHALADCDVAIVDPPRKGLDTTLLTALATQPPQRLVYLSCDLEQLRHDATLLLEHGRLRLDRLQPYALFPFTDHVETLAVFERA